MHINVQAYTLIYIYTWEGVIKKLVDLFYIISTTYGLFNAKIWIISNAWL